MTLAIAVGSNANGEYLEATDGATVIFQQCVFRTALSNGVTHTFPVAKPANTGAILASPERNSTSSVLTTVIAYGTSSAFFSTRDGYQLKKTAIVHGMTLYAYSVNYSSPELTVTNNANGQCVDFYYKGVLQRRLQFGFTSTSPIILPVAMPDIDYEVKGTTRLTSDATFPSGTALVPASTTQVTKYGYGGTRFWYADWYKK